jgi:tetratricopeptide (TPR) repeat protein
MPEYQDDEPPAVEPTLSTNEGDSDPIAAMLQRTRGDELDFEGEFAEGRLLRALFDTAPPEQIIGQRFVIRDRLGAGGMAEVYSAWDTKLERLVALKLLRTSVEHGPVADLLDEAKALAKVEHDNVVRVYDADVHAGRPYLTMEVIEGRTLARWLAQGRGLRAILSVFVRAGRGLAAIHDAGLVHGDFKPRNVLLGLDGRVRVADFGLAAAIGSELTERSPVFAEGQRPAGTLPYIAPEQFLGAAPSPAGDQFSFCVAMFEAIYGELPFPRRDADELRDSIERCELRFPSRPSRRVPGRLRRLLARGLRRDPAERYPDMHALVAELDVGPRSRRWGSLGIAAALFAGLCGSVVPLLREPEPPTQQHDPLAGVWDAGQRERIDAAFTDLDTSWSAGSRDTVIIDLDRWAERWRRRWAIADDVQRRCLADQRRRALVLVEQLGSGRARALRSAPELSEQLVDPSRCFDPELSASEPTPELDRQGEQLAEAAAERVAGDLEVAANMLASIITSAREHGDEQLEIDALREQARVHVAQGRRQAGLAELRRALSLATAAEDWRRVALTYVDLAWTADEMTAPELREEWLSRARAHVDGLGDDRDARLAGARVRLAAALELGRDDPAAAELELRELLDQLERLEAGRSLLALHARHALAGALARQGRGRREDTEAAFEAALELAAVVWGDGHPELAKLWSDYGIYAMNQDELELARLRMLEGLGLREAALSPPHPLLARSYIQLAQLELADGRLEHAQRRADAAAANVTEELDQDRAAEIWRVLGQIAFSKNELPLAIDHYRRSLASVPPKAGFERAYVEVELASALALSEQCDQATAYFDRSLARVEAELLPERAGILVETWRRRVGALQACGDFERARAEAIRVRSHLDRPEDRDQIVVPEL